MNTLSSLPALVIPDIHDDVVWADQQIRRYAFDGRPVIFLGDYFDSKYGEPLEAHFTACWLAESLEQRNRIHLLGNHDAAYFFYGHPQAQCSAWREECHRAIYEVLGDLKRVGLRMGLALRVGPWLLSHAGFSGRVYKGAPTDALIEWSEAARSALDFGSRHPLLGAGRYNRGSDARSGILWCHFEHEFVPLPGVHQIVGHSPSSGVRCRQLSESGRILCGEVNANGTQRFRPNADVPVRSVNWCLDAHARACATITETELIVHFEGKDLSFPAPPAGDVEAEFPLLNKTQLPVDWGWGPPAYVDWHSIRAEIKEPEWIRVIESNSEKGVWVPQGPSLASLEYSLRKLTKRG